jgi:molybdenum cofactor cytidylyltransferase
LKWSAEKGMGAGNSNDRIFGIVLAGGTASRFGRLKQIEPSAGTCLLGVVLKNALRCKGLESVILVLGHEAETVEEALGEIIENEKLEIVVNGEYMEGLSTSLVAGLNQARFRGCDAVAFLLGDMPMVDTRLIDKVVTRYRSSGCKLCYVKAEGRAGHPIIARRDLFDQFLNVRGDIGGREVVRRNIDGALAVDADDGGGICQLDINDTKDWEFYLSLCRDRGD